MAKPVLVVEDETIVRESLKDWLSDEGYAVSTAEDGEKALDIMSKHDFGAVVLDLKLPGKDGIQVLKEARAYRPDLKAIVITAYPSPETASEAMKAGALDYVIKPFTPDALEKLLQQALQGPAKPAAAGDKETEVGRREEAIAAHIVQGQAALQKAVWAEAIKEFSAALKLAPGHLDARIWLAKAKRYAAGVSPLVTAGDEEAVEAKAKPCVWMRMGVVRHRMCSRDYDCLSCEFDQQMQAAGESPEIAQALERLKALPGVARTCRYALKGEVAARLCSHLFNCTQCEFSQFMEDATEQRLVKLAARREALKKKQAKTA